MDKPVNPVQNIIMDDLLKNIPEPKNDKQYAIIGIVLLVVSGITVGANAIQKLFDSENSKESNMAT